MLKGLLKTTSKPKPTTGTPPAPLGSPPSGGATAGAGSAAAPSMMMGGGASGSIGLSGGGMGGGSAGMGMPYASTHGIEPTPRADVALPHHHAQSQKRERRRSSVVREERAAIVRELPALKDCPPAKREALFKQKLALCCVIFEWDPADAAAAAAAAAGGVPPPLPSGSEADVRAKEIKRLTLLELVEHVNSPGGQKLFSDAACEDVINMVCANIFRTLPAPQLPPGGEEVTGSGGGGEDGEEEPNMEPAWPHLQLVYELLLRFIVSPEVKAKTAKKWIDSNFCTRFIEMFDSEDPRERDYLKTILHRIYGKFMSHRSLIRKAISHVFYRFVYETEKHAGVGELLEILGSIINGFALPLKPEHVTFLERALIPLHHPRSIATYFQQLCYCVTQYVEKDPATAATVIKGLVRSWPLSSSSKQITLLNELEEVLELAGPEHVLPVARPLFLTLAKCVGSTHFQVAERALFLWNNEGLVTSGILSKAYANDVLPLLYTALTKNASGHWNNTVETLAQNVLKHYHDANPALYERCAADSAAEPQQKLAELEERRSRWAKLEALAAENAGRGGAPMSYSLPLSQVTAPQKNALIAAGLGAAIGVANGAGLKGLGPARPVALSASTAQVLAMAGR